MTAIPHHPRVSVIMSCYNATEWLDEAVDSLLGQTFRDFELILVDDGSTDGTWSHIQSYGARDKRVVALHKPNTGLTDSLNAGLAVAKGQWIARMDADDISEPTRLEEQARFVEAHPDVVLLGTGFVEMTADRVPLKVHHYPATNRLLVWNLEHIARFFPHSSAFFNLTAAKKVGLYNARLRRAQDWRLWLDLSTVGRITCLRSPLVRIRKHPAQISHAGDGTRQIYDAVAGTVGHLLRRKGHTDPCEGTAENWNIFLRWIEDRVRESDHLERHGDWNGVRATLFGTDHGIRGPLSFGSRLFASRHIGGILKERIFGVSLPHRLVRDWIRIKCAE